MRNYNDMIFTRLFNEAFTPDEEAPAESGGEAPAEAGSAPEPAAEPAAEASPEPAESAEPAENEAPAEVGPWDDFDIEQWDGTVDKLPEALRSHGEKFGGYYTSRHERLVNDIQKDMDIYKLLATGDDPESIRKPLREEYDGKLTEASTRYEELNGKYTALEAELKARATKDAEAWLTKHKDMLADESNRMRAFTMMEHGIDPADVPALVARDDKVVVTALAYINDKGLDSHTATRLAMLDHGKAPHGKGRDTKKLPPVAGSDRAGQAPATAPKALDSPDLDGDEATRRAVSAVFRSLG